MLYPEAIEDDAKLAAESGSSSDEEIQVTKTLTLRTYFDKLIFRQPK